MSNDRSRIKVLANAVPMVNVNTGISRYLRCLYGEMERIYGHRLEMGYFDGWRVSSRMPGGPADLGRWTKGVDLFWDMPVYPALMLRLGFHFMREAVFRYWSRSFDLYHEAGFFPFSVSGRAKTVFTIHDLSLIRFPQHHPRERVLYSRLFLERRCRKVDHFLAVSEFTAQEMAAYLSIPPERIQVTPEAVDKAVFYPRSPGEVRAFLMQYHLPDRYFLFVGAGDPRKNADILPKALETAGLDIPLVVTGWSGWSSREAGSERTILLGYVSDHDLARAYSGALALIFPSSYEGFGLPVLEAMACGCPVVTTRETSLPEVAGDAVRYMKEPRDVDDLAKILRELADRPATGERLAQRGLTRVRAFSWEKTAQQTYAVFEALTT